MKTFKFYFLVFRHGRRKTPVLYCTVVLVVEYSKNLKAYYIAF